MEEKELYNLEEVSPELAWNSGGLSIRGGRGKEGLTQKQLAELTGIGKAKSVGMSEEGFRRAKELFERHFAKKATVIPMPKLSKDAKRRWDQVPESIRKEILDSVWCSHCRGGSSMQLREGEMSGRSLVLRGVCKKCGGETARVVEPGEE